MQVHVFLFRCCKVLPVPSETVSKLLGNRVAVSPIVTVEPRRRKFHRPITLTIPAPTAAQKGMLNQYGGETPTLRLLCSIMGKNICFANHLFIRFQHCVIYPKFKRADINHINTSFHLVCLNLYCLIEANLCAFFLRFCN